MLQLVFILLKFTVNSDLPLCILVLILNTLFRQTFVFTIDTCLIDSRNIVSPQLCASNITYSKSNKLRNLLLSVRKRLVVYVRMTLSERISFQLVYNMYCDVWLFYMKQMCFILYVIYFWKYHLLVIRQKASFFRHWPSLFYRLLRPWEKETLKNSYLIARSVN